MDNFDLSTELRKQSDEIASAGHNGWGNTMLMAADEIQALKAKLARVEALAMEFGAMEIGANAAADRSEYPQDHLQNVGRAQAYGECMKKLREALGEKEAG